ncbi:hypothetical protein AeNC1_000618 [Aphanomyces euteiches]|nr:hypothetical protein AeNC1_000618 [Aphanomyces euteiches]
MVAVSDRVRLPCSAIDEVMALVEQISHSAHEVKRMSLALAAKSSANPEDDVQVKRSSLDEATMALEDCSQAVHRALDMVKMLSDVAPDLLERNSSSDESIPDDNNYNGPNSLSGSTESDDDNDENDNDDNGNDENNSDLLHHCESTHQSHRPSVSERSSMDNDLPKELQLETMHHLLFVVHGIGEHEDFKQGYAGDSGDYPTLKSIFRTLQTTLFRDVPLVLDLESIEWHDALHKPTGVDSVFDMIAPHGSKLIRGFNKHAFMDLLYYSAPAFGQVIIDAVTNQLNEKYRAFRAARPDWNGKVSIFAHSLGTIIAYDILTHRRDECDHGITYRGLDFTVDNFFATGSPIPVMVLARGDVDLDNNGTFTPGIRLPQCQTYVNIVHPSDPIAYRVEPLLYPISKHAPSPSVSLVSASRCRRDKMTFPDILALYDDLIRPVASGGGAPRYDFEMRRYRQEGLLELANAPAAHATYWASEDVVLFSLLHICRPVADILRQYKAQGVSMPALSSRSIRSLTPSTHVTFATSVSVKHHVAWHHSRVLLADSSHLYFVRKLKNGVACKKRWSLQLSSHSKIQLVDDLCFTIQDHVHENVKEYFPFRRMSDNAEQTKTLTVSTHERRNEWLMAIQDSIASLSTHRPKSVNEIDMHDLDMPSREWSIEYFGARKTGHAKECKARRWLVLSRHGTLDCYEADPILETLFAFTIADTTVRHTPSKNLLRVSSHTGIHLDIQAKHVDRIASALKRRGAFVVGQD